MKIAKECINCKYWECIDNTTGNFLDDEDTFCYKHSKKCRDDEVCDDFKVSEKVLEDKKMGC